MDTRIEQPHPSLRRELAAGALTVPAFVAIYLGAGLLVSSIFSVELRGLSLLEATTAGVTSVFGLSIFHFSSGTDTARDAIRIGLIVGVVVILGLGAFETLVNSQDQWRVSRHLLTAAAAVISSPVLFAFRRSLRLQQSLPSDVSREA